MPSCNLNIHIEPNARQKIEQIRDAYMTIKPGTGRPGIAAIVNFALMLVPLDDLPKILNPEEPTNGTTTPEVPAEADPPPARKRGGKGKRGDHPTPARE